MALPERIAFDVRHAVRYRNARQSGTVVERTVPNVRHAVRYRDACQAAAAGERTVLNAYHALRYRNARQAAAAGERIVPNIRHAVRYRDARQAGAVLERKPSNIRHAVRNGVGTAQSPGALNQFCFFLIVQRTFLIVGIMQVAFSDSNACQATASAERIGINTRHTVRYCDAC